MPLLCREIVVSHFQADRTIASSELSCGCHPSAFAIRSELATSTAGSPGRLGPALIGMSRPVIVFAASITSFTV